MSPAENGREHGAGDSGRRVNSRRRFRPGREAGTLVLIGGATTPTGPALGAFLDRSHAREGGRIVGLTTASADPGGSAQLWGADFTSAGATNFEFPIVPDRAAACDPRIAAMLAEADGIFLGGGDQVHLIASLSGTPTGEAIKEAFARGVTVGGTSAGAAALTETTLAGGEVDEEGNLVEMYIGPGLGLLGFRAIIDTHFAQRKRLQRLFVAIAGYPQMMGLGLDEDTALVVHGHLGTVIGHGGVTFVDGSTVRFDNADEIEKGRQITFSHMRVGVVGSGHVLDLRARELQAVVDGERAPMAAVGEAMEGE